jgi:hypothetical protein
MAMIMFLPNDVVQMIGDRSNRTRAFAVGAYVFVGRI